VILGVGDPPRGGLLFGNRKSCRFRLAVIRYGALHWCLGVMSVRFARPKLRSIAAWLGILALSLNALVPVHVAFDLAGVLGIDDVEHAAVDHQHHGRDLLAALAGHRDAGSKSDRQSDRHRVDCFFCGALGSLAGFAPAAGLSLPIPFLIDTSATLTACNDEVRGTSCAAYRSRAPPNG
jgi:hypothetical protein